MKRLFLDEIGHPHTWIIMCGIFGLPLLIVGSAFLFAPQEECVAYSEVVNVGPCGEDVRCRAILADGSTVSAFEYSFIIGEKRCSQFVETPSPFRVWRSK